MSSETRGFTLIEVMVALLLMALMSVLSWRALDSMVRTREALELRGQQFDGVRTLFAQWETDCHDLGSPDGWVAGVPLHFDNNRVDLIRSRADGSGAQHPVLVTYRRYGASIQRLESPPISGRAELLQSWATLQEGGDLDTLYAVSPVVLMTRSGGLGGQGFMDGADWTDDNDLLTTQWLQPKAFGNALLMGAALSVTLLDAGTPLRKVCVTGQN
ncbi:MAG: prepilin-type N-terminal cleavage/methylation domain-containing protein [Betaproteobacteria bacterium]|nr:prepilin-type N-terminal cleavage/methylation domain-containing protein [Betaproteobacteria bacterium]